MPEHAHAETESANEMVFTEEESRDEWEGYLAEEGPAESTTDMGLGSGLSPEAASAMEIWGDGAGAPAPAAAGIDLPTVLGTGANVAGVSSGLLDMTLQLSQRSLPAASTVLRGGGGGASLLGMGVAGHDMYENGIGVQNSADMFASGAGLLGAVSTGPVGAVAGAFSLGYGAGQLLDQQFGISDAVYDTVLADEPDNSARSSPRLGWINGEISSARWRAMMATSEEERAEAQREVDSLERVREDNNRQMLNNMGFNFGDD